MIWRGLYCLGLWFLTLKSNSSQRFLDSFSEGLGRYTEERNDKHLSNFSFPFQIWNRHGN